MDASPSHSLLQFNGSAFCDGVCAQTPHTAFHSTMYALAFGAVSTAHQDAAWGYLRDRISTDGLPCGVYPAQYAVAALYTNARDRGLTALRVLTRSVFGVRWLVFSVQCSVFRVQWRCGCG